MLYFSTNKISAKANFKTATIQGQAPDKGLYFPDTIPRIEPGMLSNIESWSNAAIAYEVIRPYVNDSIPAVQLKNIVEETLSFPIPLVSISDHISSLELFHGPTLAFKDVGARFMSRCLSWFLKDEKRKVTVLVATSGDTGGAVANGFYNMPNIDVVILYPSGKVSAVQEKQLTSLGNNIHALEVQGSFDDCQQMVKAVFADHSALPGIYLTSANSINIARWLPQQFYYFLAYKQWEDKHSPPVIAVPSGNFGNVCAGLLAQASGLPVKHFIAACNANDVIPQYLSKGSYHPHKAIATISNAMDVGDPSNFVRILELFNNELHNLKSKLSAVSVSDDQTRETIREVYTCYKYLLDPHGAVAYTALHNYLSYKHGERGIIIETAHPVKFFDTVEAVTGAKIGLPEAVAEQMSRPKKSQLIENKPAALIAFLLTL